MTPIVPTRRRDSITNPGNTGLVAHSLPVLARLPRIEMLRAEPAGSADNARTNVGTANAFVAENGDISTAHGQLPTMQQSAHLGHQPHNEYADPHRTDLSTGNQAASQAGSQPMIDAYRVDSPHQAMGQHQATETHPFGNYQPPAELHQHAHQPDSSRRDAVDGGSSRLGHRLARKIAMMFVAVIVMLTPLYFLLGRSTSTVQPQPSSWPSESLQADGSDTRHQPLDQESPRMAEQHAGRPYAPHFPQVPKSPGDAGDTARPSKDSGVNDAAPNEEIEKTNETKEEANRFAGGDSNEAPRVPQVRLGKNIEAVPGGDDERNRSSIY